MQIQVVLLVFPLVSCVRIPKIVFADCDGTMLSPDHRLSEQTRSVLRELSDAGILVVPATGRAWAGPWVDQVLSEPALRNGVPGIYLNGGLAVDETGSMTSSFLSDDVVARTLSFANTHALNSVVYTEKEALIDSPCELTARLAAVGDAPLRTVEKLQSDLADAAKILLLVLLSHQLLGCRACFKRATALCAHASDVADDPSITHAARACVIFVCIQ